MAKQKQLHETIRRVQEMHEKTRILNDLTLDGLSLSRVLVTDDSGNRIDEMTDAMRYLIELNRERKRYLEKILNYGK